LDRIGQARLLRTFWNSCPRGLRLARRPVTIDAAASARAQSVAVVQDGRGDLDNNLAGWLIGNDSDDYVAG
jgi:hypothetical protein